MDLGLKDKCCVVTGCLGGLGQAIGRSLLTEGARLIAMDRLAEDEGRAKAETLLGAGVGYRVFDALRPATAESAFHGSRRMCWWPRAG